MQAGVQGLRLVESVDYDSPCCAASDYRERIAPTEAGYRSNCVVGYSNV